MAGTLVTVIPPRVLDFSGLGMGQSMTLVLRSNIDVIDWIDASLLVRVNNMDLEGGDISIMAQFESPSPDDPGLTFTTNSYSSITLYDGVAEPPSYHVAPVYNSAFSSGLLGPALRIVATGTRYNSGNIAAVCGVELRLTNHVD
jgi:hypothetical protein